MPTELLSDGQGTKITFVGTAITLWQETSVTPPAITGDGPIPMTTHYNTGVRTQKPKKLKSIGNVAATVKYDPEVIDVVMAQLQVNQQIKITFPDLTTLTFWGWLEEFNPGACEEGAEVTADIVVMISNLNASDVITPPDWAVPA